MAERRPALWIGLLLVFALIGSAAAYVPSPQAQEVPPAGDSGEGRPPTSAWWPGREDLFAGPAASPGQAPPSELFPRARPRAIDLGEPGFSLRYVRTFGVTEEPYPEDTAHLNQPVGVGTSGDHVWIAEAAGRRALKFASNGTFLMQIGRAGLLNFDGAGLCSPQDVAVAPGDHVAVVDRCAHQVVVFDGSGARVLELGRAWEAGSSNDRFSSPAGIALDSAGNLYVSDEGNHRIQVFTPAGAYLTTLGVTGVAGSDNAHFNSPRHISVDSNDRLFVADAGNHRVQVLNVSNLGAVAHLGTLGVAGQAGLDSGHLNAPQGAVADVARGRVFVSDRGNGRVQVFNYATLAYQATHSGFLQPSDVAVDAAGNLYVAEPGPGAFRVQQLDVNLNQVRTFGTAGVPYLTDTEHYNQPAAVAVAPDGSLYVGESAGARLVKLNESGVPLWARGRPGVQGTSSDEFGAVEAVVLDPAGRVYAVDRLNCRVQIFSPAGDYVTTLGSGCGSGDQGFREPRGIAIAPDGTIYVADTDNHRVQVFDASRSYAATLGETGVPGSDADHLNHPHDVAVAASGTIYVADHDNHRVQIFSEAGTYLGTLGEGGVRGDDFSHLTHPTALGVDGAGRVYVADQFGERVQVFDASGAYLTTVGGAWGPRSGQMRGVMGVAVDGAGNLYTADSENHRLQQFALGVPGWQQENLNGFGDLYNHRVTALASFGQLFVGTANHSGSGAQLWRQPLGGSWEAVTADGFGDPNNYGINHLQEFNGSLYAGTWNWDVGANQSNGGQVWRSSNGTSWTKEVDGGFGDPTNGEVFRFALFGNMLYAATWSYSEAHGTEIWRSLTGDSGSWARVVSDGFGDANNQFVFSFEPMGGYLYASTGNLVTGAEVWRTNDGTTWNPVSDDGLGDPDNWNAALAAFHGALYAGTYNYVDSDDPGAELWRCQTCDGTDWEQVPVGKGFGDQENRAIDALVVYRSKLYAFTRNEATGMQVWRSADGFSWEQVGVAGLGDSNNVMPYYDNSAGEFLGRLYVGTGNPPNGGELWRKAVTADMVGTPTRGPAPLTVSFTNQSAGDYTSSQWDFGDGTTSTVTSPTHVYTAGVYSVTLTVSDGLDSNTLVRQNYIRALPPLHLPLVAQGLDPLLYDAFEDPTFDGAYDPALWQFAGSTTYQMRQEDGVLVFPPSGAPAKTGAVLGVLRHPQRSLHELRQLEARLKMSTDRGGGFAFVKIQISSPDIAGHGWWTQCMLATAGEWQPYVLCDVVTYNGAGAGPEYLTPKVQAQFDRWYTVKILADPETGALAYYLDDALIGTHAPADAPALRAATNLEARVGVWNEEPNGFISRYIDDVRITGGRQ